jgi:hypothetical protein
MRFQKSLVFNALHDGEEDPGNLRSFANCNISQLDCGFSS